MAKLNRLAVVLLLISLSGCSGGGKSTALKPADKNANPDVLVSNAVESRASLSSLAGHGVMRIVDSPNRFGLTVNANVVASGDAEGASRLRIRGDKLAGTIQAFDIVMLGDDIGFYVPTQKTLYHGKVDDLRNFSFNFNPDEVLRQMLAPDTSLLLKKWRHVPATGRGKSNDIVLEEDAPDNRPRLQVAINSRTGMITSVSQLDSNGDPVLVKTFGDFRGLNRGRASRTADESVYPFLMSLSWPRERRSMELHFKTVEGDAVVLEEDFDLATSDDTRYLPLRDARMESDLNEDPLASADVGRPAERTM